MHEIGGTRMQAPRVLDPCCGSRMFYFDRAHPDVLFGDLRSETIVVRDRSHGREDGTRTLHIRPDMRMDFRALPFADSTFPLVIFDPPHLVRAGKNRGLPPSTANCRRTGGQTSPQDSANVSAC